MAEGTTGTIPSTTPSGAGAPTTPPTAGLVPPAGGPGVADLAAGAGTPTGGAGTTVDPPQTYDAAYVQQLRREAAETRKALRETEARLKGLEEANMTDLQKAQAEAATYKEQVAKLVGAQRQADVLTAAAKAGAAHPEVVARMVPEDATDLVAAVEGLRKSYPVLFKVTPGSADGGAGGAAGSGQGAGGGAQAPASSMNELMRAAYKAHRA